MLPLRHRVRTRPLLAGEPLADPVYALVIFCAGMCFGIAAALLVIRAAVGGGL